MDKEGPDKPRFGVVGREREAIEIAENEFVGFCVFDRIA